MRTVSDYIGTPFKEKGRHFPEFDCWGLARDAAVELFGQASLPEFGEIEPKDHRKLTRAASFLINMQAVQKSSITEGAFATGWLGGVCIHIGIVVKVDGRVWVLDTGHGVGGRLATVEKFSEPFERVVFYVAT